MSTGAARSEPSGLPHSTRRPVSTRRSWYGVPGGARCTQGDRWCQCRPGRCAVPSGGRVHIRSVPWARRGKGRAKISARTSARAVPDQCQNSAITAPPPDHPTTRHTPPTTPQVPGVFSYSVPSLTDTAPAISDLCQSYVIALWHPRVSYPRLLDNYNNLLYTLLRKALRHGGITDLLLITCYILSMGYPPNATRGVSIMTHKVIRSLH